MADINDHIDQSLVENERAKKLVARITSRQIRNAEHRDFLKATALSWFRTHRLAIAGLVEDKSVATVDEAYQTVLDATERASAKTTFSAGLKKAKAALIELRGCALIAVSHGLSVDSAPDFSVLAATPEMQAILVRRWVECGRCIEANAPLAATVMMGGLLEALLVSRANMLRDKAVLVRSPVAPKDSKTAKPLPLQQWKLFAYIDVGHDLKWISRSAKDVAAVLRDYRNYIHPERERSHGVVLSLDDAKMLWEVTKTLSRELLAMKGSV